MDRSRAIFSCALRHIKFDDKQGGTAQSDKSTIFHFYFFLYIVDLIGLHLFFLVFFEDDLAPVFPLISILSFYKVLLNFHHKQRYVFFQKIS